MKILEKRQQQQNKKKTKQNFHSYMEKKIYVNIYL